MWGGDFKFLLTIQKFTRKIYNKNHTILLCGCHEIIIKYIFLPSIFISTCGD